MNDLGKEKHKPVCIFFTNKARQDWVGYRSPEVGIQAPPPTTVDSDGVLRLGTEKIMWFNSGPRGCPAGLGGCWGHAQRQGLVRLMLSGVLERCLL